MRDAVAIRAENDALGQFLLNGRDRPIVPEHFPDGE
jgi:hypothetical protein